MPASQKTMSALNGEYSRRTALAQKQMVRAKLDAIVLTTAANIYYFSGFRTQFWESPTRPWFLVIPARDAPIAVIPEIGAAAFAKTWIADVRCWQSPHPKDEGISLLAETIQKTGAGKIGMTLGAESTVRMPLADWHTLRNKLRKTEIADCAPLMWRLRMCKSAAEIAKIRTACKIAADGFAALPSFADASMTVREIARRLQMRMLENGADDVPYMSAAVGSGGYDDIIAAPPDIAAMPGQILMIDAGARRDGYFSDFNRNYVVGRADSAMRRAHVALTNALHSGFAAVRPGARASDVWRAMHDSLPAPAAGRMGHGTGLQLTEPPSLSQNDSTVLRENMVLALEPSLITAPGKIMVCEENIVVGENGAKWLHRRAGKTLPVLK